MRKFESKSVSMSTHCYICLVHHNHHQPAAAVRYNMYNIYNLKGNILMKEISKEIEYNSG